MDIHHASRGVAAHTACFFGSVTEAKGGVEHEDPVCWHASQSLISPPWDPPNGCFVVVVVVVVVVLLLLFLLLLLLMVNITMINYDYDYDCYYYYYYYYY